MKAIVPEPTVVVPSIKSTVHEPDEVLTGVRLTESVCVVPELSITVTPETV
jgi:hypothetical protein